MSIKENFGKFYTVLFYIIYVFRLPSMVFYSKTTGITKILADIAVLFD